MRIYIGYDQRFSEAWEVAAKSARRFGCDVIKLCESTLRLSGILTRPTDRRVVTYDLNSDAPQSTDFAITRFAVLLLAHEGWCLFADSDIIFLQDPHLLLDYCDESKAVLVVKHSERHLAGTKMDGQVQSSYSRKLWSSLCLWNCSHPANRRFNLTTLNQWPGRDLHGFRWLADDEIGELPARWNHLVGIDKETEDIAALHFTQGTPDLPAYRDCLHANEWRAVQAA